MASATGMKRCTRCGELRPRSEYATCRSHVCNACCEGRNDSWSTRYEPSERRIRQDRLIEAGEMRTRRFIEKPQNLLRVLQKIEAGNYAKA